MWDVDVDRTKKKNWSVYYLSVSQLYLLDNCDNLALQFPWSLENAGSNYNVATVHCGLVISSVF